MTRVWHAILWGLLGVVIVTNLNAQSSGSEVIEVRDANDVKVGNVVGMGGWMGGLTFPIVLLEDSGNLYTLLAASDRFWGANSILFFAAAGCTGQAYIEPTSFNGSLGPLPTAFVSTDAEVFLPDTSGGLASVTTLSYLEGSTCRNYTSVRSVYPAKVPITLTFVPPFTVERAP